MSKPDLIIAVYNRYVCEIDEMPNEREYLRVVRTRYYHPDVGIVVVLMNSCQTPIDWAWVSTQVVWVVVNAGYPALALRDTLARGRSGKKRKVSPKQMGLFDGGNDGQ